VVDTWSCLMHWLFHWVLLFQFCHVLTHVVIDLCGFHELLPRNPALLGCIDFYEAATHR
jgi:hypothetical protein